MNDQPELTPEQRLLGRFIDLKRQIKELEAEAESLKANELKGYLSDGEYVEVGGQIITWQYDMCHSFDVQSALGAGDISAEAVGKHSKVTVVPKMVLKRIKDAKDEALQSQRLKRLAKAEEAFEILECLPDWVDSSLVICKQTKELLEAVK